MLSGTLLSGALLSFGTFLWLSTNQRANLWIDMWLDISYRSKAQVYWSAESGGFAEERGTAFDVKSGAGVYEVTLPAGVGRLRIDPLSEPGLIEVRSIRFTRWGLRLRSWGGQRGFEGWIPWNDVTDMEVKQGVLYMRATGPDPGFASAVPLDLRWQCALMDALVSLLVGLALTLILAVASPTARRGMRRIHKTGRFIAQSVAILALGACLTEVAMRVFHHFIPVFVFPSEGTNRFRGRPFSPNYGFHLNSHGFKDVEFAPRKRPGTVRILGLGDSFAFGVVPYEYNYLTLLEQDLGRASPPAEVINMGIPAIGPPGYLEVLVNEGLPLRADMVLLSFFMGNDFWDAEPAPPRSYLYAFVRYLLIKKPEGFSTHGTPSYVDDEPTFNPAQYLKVERERSMLFHKSNPAVGEAFAVVQRHFERLKRICDAKGLELLVVVIPDEMQVNGELRSEIVASFPGAADNFDFELPNQRLGADLQRLGIRHLDLLRPLQESGKRLYKPRDTHWNIAGNRLAADLIRDELLRGDAKFWPRPGR